MTQNKYKNLAMKNREATFIASLLKGLAHPATAGNNERLEKAWKEILNKGLVRHLSEHGVRTAMRSALLHEVWGEKLFDGLNVDALGTSVVNRMTIAEHLRKIGGTAGQHKALVNFAQRLERRAETLSKGEAGRKGLRSQTRGVIRHWPRGHQRR